MKIMHCSNCNERYTLSNALKISPRQPLILKCGHTFCELCLLQRTEKFVLESNARDVYKAQVSCPSCNKITPLLSGIKDLPVDVYLTSYIEINQNAKLDFHLGRFSQQSSNSLLLQDPTLTFPNLEHNNEIICKLCLDSKSAFKCMECESLFCESCFHKVHAISVHMKKHKPFPLVTNKLDNINTARKELDSICKDHNRPIEYFCQEDSLSICSRCYILGNHKNHSIVSFEEKNKSVINEIDCEFNSVLKVLNILNTVDKKILQTVPDIRNETKSVIENISLSFLRLHALLQVREMEFVDSLTVALKENLAHLDDKRLFLSREKTVLEEAVQDARKLIENNALLIDAEALKETFKNAKKIPCILVKKHYFENDPAHWNETNYEELLQAINSFGEIKGKQQLKIDFKTIDENTFVENDTIVAGQSVEKHPSWFDHSPLVALSNDAKELLEEERINCLSSSLSKGTKLVVKGSPQHVVVTHIRSPNDFFVQLQNIKGKYQALFQSINSLCQKDMSAKNIPFAVAKNMFVLARYSADKMWYRARIINIQESKIAEDLKITVFYIDFGNEEVVGLNDLRKMEQRFIKCPAFAIHCSLFDIAPYDENKPWSLEAIQDFHCMTQNQVFLLSVLTKQVELHEVDLVFMPTKNVLDDGFVSVRDVLVFLELGRFRTFSNEAVKIPEPSYHKVDFIQPKVIACDEFIDVVVTSASSPWDFFVALRNSNQDYYDASFQYMQDVYNNDFNNTYSLYYPRMGSVCCVKAENLKWFRGKILSFSKNKQATVSFVDTGAVELVAYNCLKKLHCDFLKQPVQAIHCKLFGISPLDGSSKIEAETWFHNVVSGSEGCIKVMRSEQFAEVILWLNKETAAPNSKSINSKLIEMNLVANTGQSTEDSFNESISGTCEVEKTGMNEEICKRFSENERLEIHIDKNIIDISQENDNKKQAVISSTGLLDGFDSVKDNTRKQKQPRNNVHKADVFLIDPQSNKLLEMKKQLKINPALLNSDSLASCIRVIISSYESPSNFYIRRLDKEENLVELMGNMQAFYNKSFDTSCPSWKLNDYCAAKYSDGQWYRCIIKRVVSDQMYEVKSVDFGCASQVQSLNIRSLNKELGTKLECAAVRCHLAELLPAGSMDMIKWSNTAIEYMTQEIKDKKLYMKQEGELNELGLPIDIIIEEEIPETAFDPVTHTYHSLRQNILKQGLAMLANKSVSHSSNNALILNETTSEVEDCQQIFAPTSLSNSVNTKKLECENNVGNTFKEISLSDDESLKSVVYSNNVKVLQVPFPPMPVVGTKMTVFPTYIREDGTIWSQPLSWAQDLAELCEELLKLYSALKKEEIREQINWSIGDFCVSQFEEDGLWYRAMISNIKADKAEVQYIDYGNSAWVRLTNLQEISLNLLQKHRLCYSFRIHDISIFPSPILDLSAIHDINKLLVSAECNLIVKGIEESTNLIYAELSRVEDDLNLKDYLINSGLAVSISEDKHIYAHSRIIGKAFNNIKACPRLKCDNLNGVFKAVITHIERPDVIYLQPALVDSNEDQNISWNKHIFDFENLMEKLNMEQALKFEDMTFEEGQLVEGNYTVDNRWYRAVLVKNYPHSKLSLITYFDFGTTEVLSHDRLRPLSHDALTTPVMAWRCHLPLLPPEQCHGTWTQQILFKINNCLFGREVAARIINLTPITVLLYDIGSNRNDILKYLVDNGLAQMANVDTDNYSENEKFHLTKLYNIAGIDCQLTENEMKEIKKLTNEMTSDLLFMGDETPFWSLGYENLLTEEQRREMVRYLAKRLFHSRETNPEHSKKC